jgi:hypothetical protein
VDLKFSGANAAPAQQFRVFSVLLLTEKKSVRNLALEKQQELIFYFLFTTIPSF